VFFTASPRHADVLLVTGAGARGMAGPLRTTYDGMPDPKVVIAAGADAVSGGLLSQSEAVTGGVTATVPVDVWLPGSPPSPFGILNALLIAVGHLASGGKGSPASQRDAASPGLPREPKGRGVAWTEERGTSDEGRRRLESGPEASGKTERAGEAER